MRFPFRLLPALIFVGVMMLSVKIGNIWQGFAALEGSVELRPALAAENSPAPPEKPDGQDAASRNGDAGATAAPSRQAAAAAAKKAASSPPEDDLPDPDQLSRSEIQLLQQLSKRRDLLEHRARRLNRREALLKAAEQKLIDRQSELVSMRAEVKRLLNDLGDKERKRIANLVKIYETMKPKQAAEIFNELDMAVLLGVVERMKARKVAPLIAAMKPDKAREVTRALARRQKEGAAAPMAPPFPGGK